MPKPINPTPTPPTPNPQPQPAPKTALSQLTGTVKTKRPNSGQPYGIPWSNVSRWEPSFTNAGKEFSVDPFLLAAMAVVESDSTQFDGKGNVISRDDGLGDGPSVGIMQVKPKL